MAWPSSQCTSQSRFCGGMWNLGCCRRASPLPLRPGPGPPRTRWAEAVAPGAAFFLFFADTPLGSTARAEWLVAELRGRAVWMVSFLARSLRVSGCCGSSWAARSWAASLDVYNAEVGLLQLLQVLFFCTVPVSRFENTPQMHCISTVRVLCSQALTWCTDFRPRCRVCLRTETWSNPKLRL